MDRAQCPLRAHGFTHKLVAVLAVCCVAMAWQVACSRPAAADTPPAPIHRIVAVGDLHGDFEAWRAIARAAGLIDGAGHWTGGDTVLVQDGDVVDRGPDSLRIIHDLMRLEREAPRAHGRVIAVVGNHEAMNMTDDLRYVSPADYAAFVDGASARRRDAVFAANEAAITDAYRKRDPAMTGRAIRAAWYAATPLGWVEHQAAWAPNGAIGAWVVGHPAVVRLDDTIFVHGGISLAYACLPIAEINRRVAAALRAQDKRPGSIINDPSGPLWYRGLVTRDPADPTSVPPTSGPCKLDPAAPPPSMEQELNQVLSGYGAQRMVVAHTPILSGIAVLHGGRLVRIDTGISVAFGGKLSFLEILDGVPTTHETPRPSESSTGE